MRPWTHPDGRAARIVGRATVAFAIVCLLLAAAVGVLLGMSGTHLLARPMRIPVAATEGLGRALVPLALTLAVFGVFGLVGRFRRSAVLCFLCFALFMPLGANAGMGVIEVIFSAKSGRPVARQIPALPAGTELACLECYPNGVPFYLRRTAILISRDGGELTSNYVLYSLEKEPQWPKQIVPLKDFDDWLAAQKTPVYLIVRRSETNQLETIAAARGATIQPLGAGLLGRPAAGPGSSLTMCGICGNVAFSNLTAPETARLRVKAMLRSLSHRGPDAVGRADTEIGDFGRDAAGHPGRGRGRQPADGGRGQPASSRSATGRLIITTSCGAGWRSGAARSTGKRTWR